MYNVIIFYVVIKKSCHAYLCRHVAALMLFGVKSTGRRCIIKWCILASKDVGAAWDYRKMQAHIKFESGIHWAVLPVQVKLGCENDGEDGAHARKYDKIIRSPQRERRLYLGKIYTISELPHVLFFSKQNHLRER